ncbi:PREDICTED: mitochondrial cardiolipin hydrolase [Polistes dominula]|uniref:Mitochondrial cardiolipin hydrolase n=1 Tax=Polistes dominula TaxID=743375 RepID=A0ABM1HZM2_POLDO|nr:PREDICTED: mitochondrial cardiolipin hydrolase [Polistes dominula]
MIIFAITSVIRNITNAIVSKLSRGKYTACNMTLVKQSLTVNNLVIYSIIASVIITTSKYLWKKYKRFSELDKSIDVKENLPELNHSLNNEFIMETLFFTEESDLCRMHLGIKDHCERLNCSVASLNKLKYYLESAKKTIHVCMYLITLDVLANAIITAHERGIVIKIISDNFVNRSDFSQLIAFRKACIKVRTRQSTSLMHHKFVIIDNNILITGSANWTMQALFGNAENIIVTNHPILVEKFVNEFDNLWKIFNLPVTNL